MKKTVFIIGVLCLLPGLSLPSLNQVNNTSDPIVIERSGELGIDEAIELQEEPQKRSVLLQFRSQYQHDDRITVREYQDYWEIIVDHPDTGDDYTGGAECYRVDKQSGVSEMIWHEHPMEIGEMINEIQDEP